MHRPSAARTHPAAAPRLSPAPRLRVLGTVLVLASVTTLLTTVSGRPAGGRGSSDAGAPSEQIALASAPRRVELKRHTGSVTGDGQTIFLANRTWFRPRRARVELPPRLRGRSWVVVDLETGRLLGKHEARTRLPQASTMKLLTAVTAVKSQMQLPHRVSWFEAHQICTCAGLVRGARYDLTTMLEGMLLPSGNDAAEAVAGSFPAGRDAFYAKMNSIAHRLGAADTVARNASGLTAEGSHSSARDLVLLLRAALRHRPIREVLSMPWARIATINGRHRHRVWRGTDYANMYPDSLGKSGYTTPAKNTLVVVTSIDGRRLAVSVMGAPSGYATSDARKLTLWADRNFSGLRAVGRLPNS